MSPQFGSKHKTHARSAAAVAVTLLLTGCGSSGTSSAPPPSNTAPHSGSVPLPITSSNSPSSTAPSPAQTAGAFTASDSSGNTASMVISLGTIQPANQITDSLVQACSSDLASIGSSLDRSLAVPITIGIQLTSSLSSTLGVNLNDQYLAVAGSAPEKANSTPIFFAEGYANGPQCASTSLDPTTAGQILWHNVAPGVQQTWRGYIIQADAMTPNNPTGANSDLHRLLLNPTVNLSETTPYAQLNYITTNSPFEVLCQHPLGQGGGWQLLAIDPSAVLNYGCSPA